MALTRGTTAPFTPYTPGSQRQSAVVLSVPYTSSSAIAKGDVLVISSGLAVTDNDAQTDGLILGIAMEAKASAASMDYQNQVLVAAAVPGQLFAGHVIAGAGSDYTANAAALMAPNTAYDTVLNTDAYAAYACINQGDTTGGQVRLIQYDNAQLQGKVFTAFGNTVIVNPRVIFTFRSTVFQPVA